MGYDYDQTHDNILNSAKEHFLAKGFSGASIRQICKDAGVTNGAFYAHFDSKEALFSDLVDPIINGMQELYDEENRSYMEIHSVKDIKNVMEQTFSSNRRMIRYVYEHVDIFRLLLTSSSGTEYDNFVEKLAKEEAANTMEFFDKCSQYIDNTEKISEGLIKQISHFVVSSIFDGLLEDKTEDEVVRETELSSEFCLAGMKHFLNIS
ncbi:MAG: TetR/AcrR family transcriptional regulator [Lachnospiraceae bacterium]|nr:TetR/AcrR family transcriptional regulator [Lachnospiraceae bacterium]